MGNARYRACSTRRMVVQGIIGVMFFAAAATTTAETPLSKASADTPARHGHISSFSGAGATFPYPIYARWSDAYKKETGIELNYQGIGSGAGIKQILARAVTFGASDAPLSETQLSAENMAQFPTVLAGIVAVVNLDGVGPGDLILDGPTVARIYLGDIKKWNDPAIKILNPSLRLPPTDVFVIHRGDGSGTTFIWTDYLAKVSPAWRSRVGSDIAVEWPVGYGAKGSEGIGGPVAQTKGSIGYMEFAYAKQNRLSYVKLVNRDGRTVAPDRETIQAAALNADWAGSPGFGVRLTDQPGARSWPAVHTTYVMMPKNAPNAREAAAALAFFNWGYDHGGALADDLDYVPLPPDVIALVKKSWRDITANGTPVFSAD